MTQRIISYAKRIAVLLALCVGIFYFIYASEWGLRLSVACFTHIVPGKLTIRNVKGTFASSIHLDDVHYRGQKLEINIKQINFAWHTVTLFNKAFALAYEGLTIQHAPIVNTLKTTELKPSITTSKTSTPSTTQKPKILLQSSNGSITGTLLLSKQLTLSWQANSPDNTLINQHVSSSYPVIALHFTASSKGQWNKHAQQQATLHITGLDGKIGAATIAGDFRADYNNGTITVDHARLSSHHAAVELNGTFAPQWDIHWKIKIPVLNNWLPNLKGNLNSIGQVSGSPSQPHLQAKLNIINLETKNIKIRTATTLCNVNFNSPQTNIFMVTLKNISYQNERLLPSIEFKASPIQNHKNLQIPFHLKLNPKNRIFGTLLLAPFNKIYHTPTLNGQIGIELTQLSDLISPIAAVKKIKGSIYGAFNLSGKLMDPIAQGKLNLHEGSAWIPSLGMNLTHLNITSNFNPNQSATLNGIFTLGEGHGTLTGNIQTRISDYHATIHLNGERLQVLNTPEYKIVLSPTITILHDPQQLNISGNVLIPQASIAPQEMNNVLSLPDETVIINPRHTQTTSSTIFDHLALHVTLVLGNAIHLRYENLIAKLGGNVRISKPPGSAATGIGELYAHHGKYRAYGQSLNIQTGRLLYTGNLLTDPGLLIRAIKKIRLVEINHVTPFNRLSESEDTPTYTGVSEGTAGVSVTGTLNHPNISLFSMPAMSQNDILSYLLFGYPQSQINSKSSIVLLNQLAANANSNYAGLNNFTNFLQKKLHLTNLTMGTTEFFDPKKNTLSSTNTINIGKQLYKNLYISYSAGLPQSLSILNLRYKISKHFSIQAESSTLENGIDIFYEFTKD